MIGFYERLKNVLSDRRYNGRSGQNVTVQRSDLQELLTHFELFDVDARHRHNHRINNLIMPKELTAENGAKYLFSGEFFENIETPCTNEECDGGVIYNDDGESDCPECSGGGDSLQSVPISWTLVKEIYAMAVKHLGKQL